MNNVEESEDDKNLRLLNEDLAKLSQQEQIDYFNRMFDEAD